MQLSFNSSVSTMKGTMMRTIFRRMLLYGILNSQP
jgi:hypothetical protein